MVHNKGLYILINNIIIVLAFNIKHPLRHKHDYLTSKTARRGSTSRNVCIWKSIILYAYKIIWNRAGSLTLWYACNCIKFIHWKWFEILQKLKSLFLKLYMLNLIIVFKERMCCFSLILFHIPTLIPTNVNHSWMCIRKSSFLLSLKTPVQIVSLCPTDKILVWFPTSQK